MDGKITYKDAGVDLELGNDASKILFNASKLTWNNRKGKFGEVKSGQDSFSALRFLDIGEAPKGVKISLNSDGIGTKVEIAERMQDHSTIAFDLIAMVADDAVVRGGIPLTMATVFDTNSLSKDPHAFDYLMQIADGYVKAAADAGISVINGELAELGTRVSGFGEFNYNWGSTLLWASTSEKMIDGSKVSEGASVVMFREKGFRSNGISLLRKIMRKHYGDDWHTRSVDGLALGKEALLPSTIYCKTIVSLIGDLGEEAACDVQAVAHITGGGIPEKLGRVLEASGKGVELDSLYDPNPLMLTCQELSKNPDKEIYTIWCMGQGMAVITTEPEKVIQLAAQNGVEAKVAGKVVDKPGIRLKSKGFFSKDEWIDY